MKNLLFTKATRPNEQGNFPLANIIHIFANNFFAWPGVEKIGEHASGARGKVFTSRRKYLLGLRVVRFVI